MADNDKAQAAEYREKMTVALQGAIELMNEAKRQGFALNFNIDVDARTGVAGPVRIHVSKEL